MWRRKTALAFRYLSSSATRKRIRPDVSTVQQLDFLPKSRNYSAKWRRCYTRTSEAIQISNITPDDVQPGDIVLFSPYPGSRTAEAQVILTSAPLSHSALIWRDPSYLIESIHWDAKFSKVSKASVVERFVGREITVNRTTNPPIDDATLDRLFQEAESYLGSPYSRISEYLQGIYQLYSKLASYGTTEEVACRKPRLERMRRMVAKKMREENERCYPGQRPVLCAEFIYRCYRAAGYELMIDKGARLAGELQTKQVEDKLIEDGRSYATESLLDLLLMEVVDCMAEPDFLIAGQSTKDRVCELVRMFGGSEIGEDVGEIDLDDIGKELISKVCKLIEYPNAFESTTCTTLARTKVEEKRDLIEVDEALFVTPADLYRGCSNLTYVGTIPFK